MGKRKRSSGESLEERLEQYKTDLFRALKKVKGFERQRLSKRIREKGISQERKEKFDLEIAVLKVCGFRWPSTLDSRSSGLGA